MEQTYENMCCPHGQITILYNINNIISLQAKLNDPTGIQMQRKRIQRASNLLKNHPRDADADAEMQRKLPAGGGCARCGLMKRTIY